MGRLELGKCSALSRFSIDHRLQKKTRTNETKAILDEPNTNRGHGRLVCTPIIQILDGSDGKKTSTVVVGVETPWGEMLMRCGETEAVESANSTRQMSKATSVRVSLLSAIAHQEMEFIVQIVGDTGVESTSAGELR